MNGYNNPYELSRPQRGWVAAFAGWPSALLAAIGVACTSYLLQYS